MRLAAIVNAAATTTEFVADGSRSTVYNRGIHAAVSRSQSAFACGLRTGVVMIKVEVRERFIQSGGEDGVMVVDDEPVGMVRWYSFAQLLVSRSWLPREINRVPSRRQLDAPLR